MFSRDNSTKSKKRTLLRYEPLLAAMQSFWKQNWIGSLVLVGFTLIFFSPMISRITTYSDGGDTMFNAWTLARNHHCILRENCENYVNGNIYAPHKDTMLFSETQLSAGLLTLPLYFVNDNPLFSYNIWTIMSFFLSAWFMYLLAKRLSKNNELVSITAGLIFGFAPIKIIAVSHLQNLSIFYLPLILLFMLCYFENARRKYLVLLLISLILQFYASWYQMIFVSTGLAILLTCFKLFKIISLRQFIITFSVVVLAAISTAPLAVQYIRFSKETSAKFKISEQAQYSSSLSDYIIPARGTLEGEIKSKLLPNARDASFNPDSTSYHGLVLYLVGLFVTLGSYYTYRISRKQDTQKIKKLYYIATSFGILAILGFMLSLGPLIKIKGSYTYDPGIASNIRLVIPGIWLIITEALPQLNFIRAIGRISVLVLFALCCLLALLPLVLESLRIKAIHKKLAVLGCCMLVLFELMPIQRVHMSRRWDSYNIKVPEVYRYIKDHPTINNIVIIRDRPERLDDNFPFYRTEDVLWAGYHNRNIFNGYSGYEPASYGAEFSDFVHFQLDDVADMRKLGMQYLLIDKRLDTKENPTGPARKLLPKVYEDKQYGLYSLAEQ